MVLAAENNMLALLERVPEEELLREEVQEVEVVFAVGLLYSHDRRGLGANLSRISAKTP